MVRFIWCPKRDQPACPQPEPGASFLIIDLRVAPFATTVLASENLQRVLNPLQILTCEHWQVYPSQVNFNLRALASRLRNWLASDGFTVHKQLNNNKMHLKSIGRAKISVIQLKISHWRCRMWIQGRLGKLHTRKWDSASVFTLVMFTLAMFTLAREEILGKCVKSRLDLHSSFGKPVSSIIALTINLSGMFLASIHCIDEYAYRIPNPYATLVHQGKGTEYPR